MATVKNPIKLASRKLDSIGLLFIAFYFAFSSSSALARKGRALASESDNTEETSNASLPANKGKPPLGVKVRQVEPFTLQRFEMLRNRVQTLEEELHKLEGELEVVKAQSRLLVRTQTVSFLDAFYFKAGLEIILPRARTFDFRTDTGLGGYIGVGHYFGRSHVLDLAFEWDFYPSISLRYRYEIHFSNPAVTIAPVIGFKTKAAPAGPWDNYLDKPEELKTSFPFFGAFMGIPAGRMLMTGEFLFVTNRQSFLMVNGGVHFFL